MPFDWTRLAQTHLGVAAITLAVIEQLAAPQPIPGSTWARGFGGRPVDPEELAVLAGVPVKRLYEHLAKAETAGVIRRVRQDEGWVLEFSIRFLLTTSNPVFRDSGKTGKQEADTSFPVFPDSGNPGIPENRTPPDPPQSHYYTYHEIDPPYNPPLAGPDEEELDPDSPLLQALAQIARFWQAETGAPPPGSAELAFRRWLEDAGGAVEPIIEGMREGWQRYREQAAKTGKRHVKLPGAPWLENWVQNAISRHKAREAIERGSGGIHAGGAGTVAPSPGGDRPKAPGPRAAAEGARSRPTARDQPVAADAYWDSPWVARS